MRLAYLFSRYPIVSQTFCDTEILALEKLGYELELYSIHPPPTSFRHGHAQRMRAPLFYAPPSPILKLGEEAAKIERRWPAALVAEHELKYGPAYKAGLRARNALYFADLFRRRGIGHFHVHFANRAAHTAIFVKAISGIPFSISTHGQDFMSDLGNNDLLRDICHEAAFVANETNYSKGLVAAACPESAGKMHRVFNGMDLDNFPPPAAEARTGPVRIVSIGRLIEFKGFHHLVAACGLLRQRGLDFQCDIVGEGPWRGPLQEQIDLLNLTGHVQLRGSLPQEEVFAALRACDIFALACTKDQQGATDVFPTVILEAMASAKPVVSTKLAGVPEQIVSGESGLLVEPANERALAEALTVLITSAERREQLGHAARARLVQEFSVEHTVLPLQALFERHAKAAQSTPPVPDALACLVSAWPPHDRAFREIQQLRGGRPSLRVIATEAHAGAARADTLALFDFLPDGMVLEGEWQQERALARRIETWRVELGEKLSSEVFLRHARHALYLRSLAPKGVRHLHILDPRELLTGWLLQRLCGITLSLTLDTKPSALGDSTLAKLIAPCAGVRCSLPEDEWSPVAKLLPRSVHVARTKPGKPFDAEWLRRIAAWSNPH